MSTSAATLSNHRSLTKEAALNFDRSGLESTANVLLEYLTVL